MTNSTTFSPPAATESRPPGANETERNRAARNPADMTTATGQHGQAAAMVLRKVVRIDPALCNGCAACVVKCPQNALEVVGGRAVLMDEELCDGLGFCAGACPRNAIVLEDRYAAPFRGGSAAAGGDVKARDEFHRRLSICCRATECGRICRRLVKQPGKAGVWCVDIVSGVKVGLYEALARGDFRCPEGRF